MEHKNNKEKLNKIITVILVGLLLLIIVVPIGEQDEKEAGVSFGDEEVQAVNDATYYEERLKSILEKNYGAGTMEVMVHMKKDSKDVGMYEEEVLIVDGILIVADVDSDTDVGNISFAVCALFDLPAHKVAVIKNKGD